jgi:hypothetical protein
MSRRFRRQIASVASLLVLGLLGGTLVLLAGCGSSADGLRSLTTSIGVNLPPGTTEPAAPPATTWPPGIATVIMSNGFKVWALGRDGVRWSQEMETRKESESPEPFSGMAVSNNQKFIAYIEHRKYVVARSISDGAIVGRVPYQAEGETYLQCVSSDGALVALNSIPPDVPKSTTSDRLPMRVTIVDIHTGQATVQQPLQDLAKQRIAANSEASFLLHSLAWLPEHKLLVNYAASEPATYSYAPSTGTMEQIPGMEIVMSVADSGAVFGGTVATATAPPKEQIWDGGAVQPLEFPSASASGLYGAFNNGGDAFVTLVEDEHGEPLGWQLFRLTDGRWQPAASLADNTWMRESPAALSDDGTVAWSILERNTGELVLLSHDFQSGAWQEWLPKKTLPVKLDFYHFDAIIPGE